MSWLSAMFAFLSGALITCQAGANTELKKSLGHPMPAVVINYSLGLLGVLIYSVMTKVSVPPLSSISTVPWWGWIGGLLGVAYGLAAVFLGSKLGAAPLMALVLTGQLLCSVVLDNFGWIGFEVHRAGFGRILGCLLMMAGLILVAKF
jgi:transporter family-2 protein